MTEPALRLGDIIRSAGPGKPIHLKVDRDGRDIDVTATLSTHIA